MVFGDPDTSLQYPRDRPISMAMCGSGSMYPYMFIRWNSIGT